MNKKALVLGLLVIIGVSIVGYRYVDKLMEERERKASRETARTILAALKSRQELSEDQQSAMVLRARALLDEHRDLEQARALLEQVLKANFRNAPAHIEMARYYIKSGHISGRNFQPGALENAGWELDYARSAAPSLVDVDVLVGHLDYLKGNSWEAVKVLQKAYEKGTDNPWLHQNWADALMDLSRWDEAEVHLRKAQQQYAARGEVQKRVLISLHQNLATALSNRGKLAEADKEFRTAIALDPGSASTRINYAIFLLFARAMPDAALEQANQVPNAGMALRVAAAARYAKWSMLKESAPREAAEHLALAKQTSLEFSWLMPQAARAVGAGPALEAMVQGLMTLGVSLETKDENGDTGLMLAAAFGDAKSVQILLGYGAQTEAVDNIGLTALAVAAYRGHEHIVKLLASKGANVNTRDNRELTPLHRAVSHDDVATARTLIALKADVSAETRTGVTPLMAAAAVGGEEMVRILLDAGADPSLVSNEKRQTAADIAAANGHVKLSAALQDAINQKAKSR